MQAKLGMFSLHTENLNMDMCIPCLGPNDGEHYDAVGNLGRKNTGTVKEARMTICMDVVFLSCILCMFLGHSLAL